VCDARPAGLHDLLKHGAEHLAAGSLSCAFCGQASPSSVALALHQLVWEAPAAGELPCPLQCGVPPLARPALLAHLSASHGAAPGTEQAVLDTGAGLGPGAAACPACQARVAVGGQESHRILHCHARSPAVRARVAGLVSLAEAQGLTPLIVVEQEVEAALGHLASLAAPSYREEWERTAREAARRYPALPPGLAQELAWQPEGLEAGREGLLAAFPLWEQVVARLEGPAAAGLELELGAGWGGGLEEDAALATDRPEEAVVARLEGELAWGSEEEPPGVQVSLLAGLRAELAGTVG
jgi:hypothetical protein